MPGRHGYTSDHRTHRRGVGRVRRTPRATTPARASVGDRRRARISWAGVPDPRLGAVSQRGDPWSCTTACRRGRRPCRDQHPLSSSEVLYRSSTLDARAQFVGPSARRVLLIDVFERQERDSCYWCFFMNLARSVSRHARVRNRGRPLRPRGDHRDRADASPCARCRTLVRTTGRQCSCLAWHVAGTRTSGHPAPGPSGPTHRHDRRTDTATYRYRPVGAARPPASMPCPRPRCAGQATRLLARVA